MKYDTRLVQHLATQCEVSVDVALIALCHNNGSYKYALEDLHDQMLRGKFLKEARECELKRR